MTRKEKMAFKREVLRIMYNAYYKTESARITTEAVELRQFQDKVYNKAATDIANLAVTATNPKQYKVKGDKK